ncbi:rod shape-determining protein MreD [bacterium]|nr:rod shape-determining protein MreD [bacterium]
MNRLPLILTFFLFILIQSTLDRIFPQIDRFFILPNLPIILLVYISLYSGPERGTIVGFMLGFFEDSLSSELMGINSLIKTALGFFLGISASKFVVSNRILQFTCIVLMTLLNDLSREFLKAMLETSIIHGFLDILTFIFLKSFPEAMINGLLALLLFPIFERFHVTTRECNGD